MSTIKTVKLSEVQPDPNQPRTHFAEEELGKLQRSVAKFGIKNPLLVEDVGDKLLIIDGERRYRVAKELGLKEIPVIVESKKSDLDRIVEQFHIQEMHENWTSSEKASVVMKLADEMGMDIKEVGEILSITPRQLRRYIEFGRLISKENFQRAKIDINWASQIGELRKYVRNLATKTWEKELNPSIEPRLEKVCIEQIRAGNIESHNDMTKLKDSFKKEPRSLDVFLEGKTTPDQLFVRTKAKSAFHYRNINNNSMALSNNIRAFMDNPGIKVTGDTIKVVKNVLASLEAFIKKYAE